MTITRPPRCLGTALPLSLAGGGELCFTVGVLMGMKRFVIVVLVLGSLVLSTFWWRGVPHDVAQPRMPVEEQAEAEFQSVEGKPKRPVELAPLRPRVLST